MVLTATVAPTEVWSGATTALVMLGQLLLHETVVVMSMVPGTVGELAVPQTSDSMTWGAPEATVKGARARWCS